MMRRLDCPSAVVVIIGLMCAGGCSAQHGFPSSGADGFAAIFDGRTLTGWEVMGGNKQAFYVEDGVMACNGQGGDWIRYTEELDDFELHLEYKVPPDGNSGIFVRSATEGIPWLTGWEVQVLDSHGLGINRPNMHSAGAIYDVLTPMLNAARPADEWNEVRLRVKGTEVAVWMNGYKIIDNDFATLTEPIGKFSTPYSEMPTKGYLGFQDHGTAVWYRNIRLKKL